MADAGAVGFGEISVLHLSLVPHHSFTEVTPEHPLMLALVETAGRRRVVIDLHMDPVTAAGTMRTPAFLKSPLNPPTLMGNIAGFERLLAHDRNARIVWAHGGSDFSGNMTPALIGPEYFREMAAIVNAGGPPDLEKIKAVMTRHGLVPAPPQK